MSASTEIPIVLTATIRPNLVGAASLDPEARLAEYQRVVAFCQRLAPVIFLENSDYPLGPHREFDQTDRLQVRRFPLSTQPIRGKGYQEFEMLDAWLASEPRPPRRWLKITGRYQLTNLARILEECRQEQNCQMLIDQSARKRHARTHLFYVTTAFYQKWIKGLYQQCDDRQGDWIEYVLFPRLEKTPRDEVRVFKTQPHFVAKLGSTGAYLPSGHFQWVAKQCLRRINYFFDKRHLRYVR